MTRLPDLVRRSAERHPDAVALAPVRDSAGGGWSYGQLRALMERGAAVLRGMGLEPGDRVLLFLEPCAAWPANCGGLRWARGSGGPRPGP